MESMEFREYPLNEPIFRERAAAFLLMHGLRLEDCEYFECCEAGENCAAK